MVINPTKVHIPDEDQENIIKKMKEILNSGQLTLGPYTKEFENKISNITSDQYVTAVSSGTSALEIVALTFNLKDKEVIIPSNTFVATATPFLRVGSKIRFADCDPFYGSITLEEVKRLHTKDTRAVVIVHIGGIIAPDSLLIKKYCEDNDLILIEDAAHALGSSILGKPAGTLGEVGTFSFYPTKIVTSGEGGAITTKNYNLSEESRIYRDQGKVDFYNNYHTHVGSNWRLSELHAILGIFQLDRINEFIERRSKVVKAYLDQIKSEKIKIVTPPPGSESNWYKVMAIVENGISRDELKVKLSQEGVKCGGEVYTAPCHTQPIFKNTTKSSFPNSEYFSNQHLCLPVSVVMSDDELSYVCEKLNNRLALI
ncbi:MULTISPECIES: DegT/DnrJ/EryC1/StrS family aminotransferase [Cytobacillus]|uniref:dTDP-4-amino-4,6-dideoxygalactose transaminase n=1 Tax=Cytobacillus oceanisediminis TaxID=665099 RepID=A0ABX3CKH7_9BACI|nr:MULTISPECIES: DegT/DnrJ/EryC1/StrS family aminotransferase [Cytobacillus]OHX40716.1 hypothetical protein BBV17_29135 [Cytobacillus oceanisediminis]